MTSCSYGNIEVGYTYCFGKFHQCLIDEWSATFIQFSDEILAIQSREGDILKNPVESR